MNHDGAAGYLYGEIFGRDGHALLHGLHSSFEKDLNCAMTFWIRVSREPEGPRDSGGDIAPLEFLSKPSIEIVELLPENRAIQRGLQPGFDQATAAKQPRCVDDVPSLFRLAGVHGPLDR